MTGLLWTAAVWAVAALMLFLLGSRRPQLRALLSRENLALMLALLGTFSVSSQTEAEEVLAEPVVIERVLRGGLAGLALLIAAPILLSRLRQRRDGPNRAIAGLVIYVGIAALSSLYSAAPLVSAAKAFELGAALVAVLAIAYGPRPTESLRRTAALVIGSQVILLTVAVVGFFLLPAQFAFLESRPGFVMAETLFPPYAHSNAVSSMAALVGIYALARLLEGASAWMWGVISVVAAVGLVLSSGRQGLGIYLVGMLAVLWVLRRKVLLFLLGPALGLLVWLNHETIWTAISRDRPTNFATLTGRTLWWEAALKVWTGHPWLGWGYSAGGRFVALESINSAGVSSIHSGYIEMLVGVGVVGTLPFLYALVRTCGWAIRSAAAKVDVALAVLIIPLVLRTGVSLGFGGWLTTEAVLFMLLVAISDRGAIDRKAERIEVAVTPEPSQLALRGG